MLDEKALRRPDFRGGTPVSLADGQEWHLPRPSLLWVADDSEAGVTLGYGLGEEYDALARAVEESVYVLDTAKAAFAAAKFLLRLNYDLDSAAFGQLLRADFRAVREGEEPTDAQRLGRDLLMVTTGGSPAPKGRSPAGSASPG